VRLLLGLPTSGIPSAPFLESLATIRVPARCTELERSVVSGNFIPAQRELIAEEALSGGYDLLAMIDDDIVVPADVLEKLCTALDEDPQTALVGALYYSRDGLRPMVVDAWEGSDTTGAIVPAFDDRSTVVVDGVGFGCAVVRVAAMQTLERPFFSAHVFIEPKLRRVRITDEDYLFCERLRHAGYTVRLHGGVRCRHYDRATNRLIPERWEDAATTSRRRMYVRTPDGESLIDADPSLSRAREEHRAVTLDYLRVE
jgi:GT2 family glycosyltransferase